MAPDGQPPVDRRRVVLFMAALSVPFVGFGVWMLVVGAYGLAVGWFALLVIGAVVFTRLMFKALEARENR
jgi:hypothetical protein